MPHLFDKCDEFWSRMERMSGGDLDPIREMFAREFPIDNCLPYIDFCGRRMLQVATNDYLGLAMHPEAITAAAEVVSKYGAGTSLGARPLSGSTRLHVELERMLAEFRRTEACLVHNLGLGAMCGTIAALVGRKDRVFVDAYAHGCIHDGARLSRGQASLFRHNDLSDLEAQLQSSPPDQPKLIAVDGVYGMSGDLAPLRELVALKHRYDAVLFVDDAHGTGVLGENGRGTAEHFGVEDEIDLHGGTFAKAFGTFGGYVAGPQKVIDYLAVTSPAYVLTKALPAGITAATIKTLELMQRLPERRERLWANLRALRGGLREAGFDFGNPQAAVTSISMAGMAAVRVVRILQEEYDILANAVMYPAVPYGTSLLRMTASALHTEDDMRRLVKALSEIRQRALLSQAGAIA